jgi:secretion/DNA translocation related TadE-like protein
VSRGTRVAHAARDESGAASVTALGIVGAIVAVSIAVVPVLGVFVGSQQAANAADAAALAAADALSGAVPGVPCELAGAVASRNGAALTACSVEGPVAVVRVTVGRFGFTIVAAARAGPPGWSG